ncbi:MAG: hypothetical protein LUD74_00915, partial [Tannerellaceae bacterium]|nr:hypothetical protein [Tannerellaceae bacterium]
MKYLAPILLAAVWLWPTTAVCSIPSGAETWDKDSVPTFTTGYTEHAVYPENMGKKSKIYNKLWGRHYRDLYCIPVRVPVAPLDSIRGGLVVLEQAKKFHGLLLTDPSGNMYLLRPIGGSTTFLESDFFQSMYNKNDFRGTYTDAFIADAYTIINPYTFHVADELARQVGLSANNSRIFYIPANSTLDTIANGSRIQDKLVNISDIPDINTQDQILVTRELVDRMLKDRQAQVNEELYIRERLFDILVGDWNKIPENWNWIPEATDSLLYDPWVIDRNHAFTKVDGVMFKQLLNILTLGFIQDYNGKYKKVKKFNTLGFPLDVALTANTREADWVTQARYLQAQLTDAVVEEAFDELPAEIQGSEIEHIKASLKQRRDQLEKLAGKYYAILQQYPVLTGSNQSDRIEIDRSHPDSLSIRIYNNASDTAFLNKTYGAKQTKEVWLYGLEGNDRFVVSGKQNRKTPIYLISGKGDNTYEVSDGKNIRVYAYPDEKEKLKETGKVKKVLSDNETIHHYDYEKTRYSNFSFTPWGVYDSDKGISLGSYATYTLYGFKRSPFTYRHRIGYNYLQGFEYQGIFPGYDPRKSFYLEAFIGTPQYFSNFFGFGNDTDGFKDEKNNYNQVNIRKYAISPSFHLDIKKNQQLILFLILESYKVKYKESRYIAQVYDRSNDIFDMNFFADLGLSYRFRQEIPSFLSRIETLIAGGWNVNLGDVKRNF